MKFYLILGFIAAFVLFSQTATAFPRFGRRHTSDNVNENETRDEGSNSPTDQGIDDAAQRTSLEPLADPNRVQQYQIPPTMMRKIQSQYKNIDPAVLAELEKNPELASQLTTVNERGKIKKLLGIALLIGLLKKIF